MIYSKNINKALKICFSAHKNQVDKAGVPYVFHPYHLAEMMGDNEDAVIVALLHDVVEDTNITLELLRKCGFSNDVITALDLLTHKNGESYYDYIHNLKNNRLARQVKLADLEHNLTNSRLDDGYNPSEAKYTKARKILLESNI